MNANLTRAKLAGATLRAAYLGSANLTRANLVRTVLMNADLLRADLTGAVLYAANFAKANLTRTKLVGANLIGAFLQGARLIEADITDAKLPNFKFPSLEGEVRGYKKVMGNGDAAVLTLLIPVDAQRMNSLVGRKCRASRVKVLSASDTRGNPVSWDGEFRSLFDYRFTYKVGEWAEVPDYDPDIRVECTKGIHFFLDFEEAARY